MTHRAATMERAEIGRISRQGFTDDPGGPSVLVLVERRRTRKQARTATSATDITRYRSAGGAICLIRVIRWFGDNALMWMGQRYGVRALSRSAQQISATGVLRPSGLAIASAGLLTLGDHSPHDFMYYSLT